jgi:DNA invertase Pin-like site-specific DNA recombinase
MRCHTEVVDMSPTTGIDDAESLSGWLGVAPTRPKVSRRRAATATATLRFAFYGRISTREYQDATSSRAWQLDSARQAIASRGCIVAEFFDVGCSRRLPWTERPEATALLAAAAGMDHPFDAVLVGEYERAFFGDQLAHVAAALASCGVELWLPETNGPVDLESPTHQALVMLLGHQSKREILQARFRTTMAMTAQARDQSRHLGGRPPYGYRLVDAGPHPNAAHARWGRRLHRLDPDPVTAPHVRWIFAQRLAGSSAIAIARALNERGVPCPSGHDPARNPHRRGDAWTLRTVAEILANPRYTGRQIWNRYRTDHHESIPGDKRTGKPQRHLPNPKDQWVISRRVAHPPLVSEEDFVVAQVITATRRGQTPTRPAPTHSPACCAAASAAGYSTRTGCTEAPVTDAATATPAPTGPTRADPRTSTSGKTVRSPTSPPISASPPTTPNRSPTSFALPDRSSSASRPA